MNENVLLAKQEWQKSLSHCQYVHLRSHLDWPGLKPGLNL